ncbi:hypothetical protein [Pontibacillus sp. HMF3514]|uniref:hypothetical protein n=1 Tax=Pontibacillus sp. HMF3514 TaxID=2692425 RepID=UPI00131FF3E9|nr:hypothetical protein [Pontibacillus sp. HMF3514]QHE51491.1 hypothetical protein GS400_05340 [Pontibacillus sp. HMF3514]
MNAKWVIPIFMVISFMLSGCNLLSENKLPIEMIAFNSLNENEVDRILVSPKDSIVKKIKVDDDLAKVIGEDYKGEELFSVTFNHTETESKGNLIVYVSHDKSRVLGKRN